MLKNIINRVKSLVEQSKDNKESLNEKSNDENIIKIEDVDSKEELIREIHKDNEIIIENQEESLTINKLKKEEIIDVDSNDFEYIPNESNIEKVIDSKENIITEQSECIDRENTLKDSIVESEVAIDIDYKDSEEYNEYIYVNLTKEEFQYIKDIKIKRGMSIKAIDVYTKESQIFKTHKECSKKLKIPVEYIQENLKYGYTDYLGDAINYISKELGLNDDEYKNYLDSNKMPSQILLHLNNKIFTAKISEDKRDDILCSEKIEPVKMHYIFECIDEEYDDYFKKYRSIIKRGGKKKIELIDKKGEVIEIFKSLDECAIFLKKEKNEIVDMLKYKNTKIGRYEIRYSLRSI